MTYTWSISLVNFDGLVTPQMFTNEASRNNLYRKDANETVRDYYKRLIKTALDALTSPNTVIEIKGGGRPTGPAYVPWSPSTETHTGNAIYLNESYFSAISGFNGHAGVLIHEFARLFLDIGPLEAETNRTLDDVYRWDSVVNYLSGAYTTLKAAGVIK